MVNWDFCYVDWDCGCECDRYGGSTVVVMVAVLVVVMVVVIVVVS